MVVTVVLTPMAARELDELPVTIHGRVHRVLERLREFPNVSGAQPLRGNMAGFYRVRTGDYRVLFRVQGDRLMVERIGHRDRFYGD
jgi:mRNA interferase RelE/StbE